MSLQSLVSKGPRDIYMNDPLQFDHVFKITTDEGKTKYMMVPRFDGFSPESYDEYKQHVAKLPPNTLNKREAIDREWEEYYETKEGKKLQQTWGDFDKALDIRLKENWNCSIQ